MRPLKVRKYLFDILQPCEHIARFTSGKTFEAYESDAMLRSAVERQFEIIGEALAGAGDVARDLAYRLYNLCERKGWAHTAAAYNGLVTAWPELTRLAKQVAPSGQSQRDLFSR